MVEFWGGLGLGIGLKRRRSNQRKRSNEYVSQSTKLTTDPAPSPTFSLLRPGDPTTPTSTRIAALAGKHKTTPLAHQALEGNWEMVEIHDWLRCERVLYA